MLKEINGVDKGRGQLEENQAVGLDAHAQWREGGYGIHAPKDGNEVGAWPMLTQHLVPPHKCQ